MYDGSFRSSCLCGWRGLSVASTGDTPLSPEIAEVEQTLTNEDFLLHVECDPSAYLLLETTTDLLSGSWQTSGVFTAEGDANVVYGSSGGEVRFRRIRRQTGE